LAVSWSPTALFNRVTHGPTCPFVAQAGKLPVGSQEHVLRNLLCVGGVAQHPKSYAVNQPLALTKPTLELRVIRWSAAKFADRIGLAALVSHRSFERKQFSWPPCHANAWPARWMPPLTAARSSRWLRTRPVPERTARP
jgi:hypothetical protein